MELAKVDATYVSSEMEEESTRVRNKCQLPTVGYDGHDVNPAF